MPSASDLAPARSDTSRERRTLAGCCAAHILHDGYTDALYLLLPIWQSQFSLSLAEAGFLKTVYSAMLALFQIPSGMLAERFGERVVLVLGTVCAAIGYLLLGWSGGFFGLVACLALGGVGSSVQHPLSSSITARIFAGRRLRVALGTYNFSGDIGKTIFPLMAAVLIAAWDWQAATLAIGAAGFAVAIVLVLLLPRTPAAATIASSGDTASSRGRDLPPAIRRRAFAALSLIGVLDSITRMGFLALLPFLLTAKGAALSTIGTSLTLVFAGGAAGKFLCGIIAERVGILRTVLLTELITALGIIALVPLAIAPSLLLLPLIGVALNGTSSVLYGTVAELAPDEGRARAFGFFYTVSIGAGAVGPSLYGAVSDWAGVPATMCIVGAVVLFVLPAALLLRPALRLLASA